MSAAMNIKTRNILTGAMAAIVLLKKTHGINEVELIARTDIAESSITYTVTDKSAAFMTDEKVRSEMDIIVMACYHLRKTFKVDKKNGFDLYLPQFKTLLSSFYVTKLNDDKWSFSF
jgi:intergrase/recombinase